jgi:hypothetical protein
VLDAVTYRLVREYVQLLLLLALDVDLAELAEDVGQARPAHLARNDFRGETEIVEQIGQLTRGLRVQALLLHDVALNCDDGRR